MTFVYKARLTLHATEGQELAADHYRFAQSLLAKGNVKMAIANMRQSALMAATARKALTALIGGDA